MTRQELRDYFHEHIPLARALAVDVVEVGDGCVVLSAPLEPNRNHRQTAFGGSVSALAILAGWGFLRARLAASPPLPQLVIQRQEMEFIEPIAAQFTARCPSPPAAAWQRFERALAARDRSRIEIEVEVQSAGRRCASFRGTYVALRSRAPPG